MNTRLHRVHLEKKIVKHTKADVTNGHGKERRRRPRKVNLCHRDSGSMAASFTDYLRASRDVKSGQLEIFSELVSHDACGERESEYGADVEDAAWLAEFLSSPPAKIEERFKLDVGYVLDAIATLDPRLASETKWILEVVDSRSLSTIPREAFAAGIQQAFGHIENAGGHALIVGGPSKEPVLLRSVFEKVVTDATRTLAWDGAVDWSDVRCVNVLEESGFKVTPLFLCAADGMASGVWSLTRVTIGERGYLVYDFADDERYAGGALLVGWEPSTSTAAYRSALGWAYEEYGEALSFPFTRTDIEVESIRNERLFRHVARAAGLEE